MSLHTVKTLKEKKKHYFPPEKIHVAEPVIHYYSMTNPSLTQKSSAVRILMMQVLAEEKAFERNKKETLEVSGRQR